MNWLYLALAGLTEIVWATGLKYTGSFTKLWPSVLVLVFMALSFWLLSLALKSIPIGTAYAIWAGIGATGVALIGMIFLGDNASPLRIFFLIMVIIGIVGLKLVAIKTT
ncbi:DMT family transporter [Poriferisphaera sp. WC338]|uniref:DMT family transporter n=1 Tax=Poriferisphaera sp. WC338 TaxID=3425129 RepID=UPI003D81AE60